MDVIRHITMWPQNELTIFFTIAQPPNLLLLLNFLLHDWPTSWFKPVPEHWSNLLTNPSFPQIMRHHILCLTLYLWACLEVQTASMSVWLRCVLLQILLLSIVIVLFVSRTASTSSLIRQVSANQTAWSCSWSTRHLRESMWSSPIFQPEHLNFHSEEPFLRETRYSHSATLRVLFGT